MRNPTGSRVVVNDERIFETAGFIAERWRRLSPERHRLLADVEPDLIGAVDDLLYEFNRKAYRDSLNHGLHTHVNIEQWGDKP